MYWSIIVGILAVVFYRFVYPRYSSAPPNVLTPGDMAVAPVLKFLTVPATSKHTATVIFVHVSCRKKKITEYILSRLLMILINPGVG